MRWFLDGTQVLQLARDNPLSTSTAHWCLRQRLTVLSAWAPDLETPPELEPVKAAGLTPPHLDGTVIFTDRVAARDPRTDLWWSGKHKHHGGKLHSSPLRTTGLYGSRPCCPAASTTALAPATPADRSPQPDYRGTGHAHPDRPRPQNAGAGFRRPVNQSAYAELTEASRCTTRSSAPCASAKSLLKQPRPRPYHEDRCPALVRLQIEHDRFI